MISKADFKRFYIACNCGDVIYGSIKEDRYQSMHDTFRNLHKGDGHYPVDSKTAKRNRKGKFTQTHAIYKEDLGAYTQLVTHKELTHVD